VQTIFDDVSATGVAGSAETFGGSLSTGSITTSGTLYQQGTGTTTVYANLNTPTLEVDSGRLVLAQANRVANVAALTLAGGTLSTGGANQTFGTATQLTLTNNATIDFGAANTGSILTIGKLGLDATNTYVGSSAIALSLADWSGNTSVGTGTDQFLVSSGLIAGQKLYNVDFTGYANGAKVITNTNGKLELVPLGNAFTWTNGLGSNLWNVNNWSSISGPGFPSAPGDEALFTDAAATLNGSTVSTGAGATAGQLAFNSTLGQVFTIAGGTLTLDSGDPTTMTQISVTGNSSPTITAPITLKQSLTIANNGSGVLDLNSAVAGPNTGIMVGGTGTTELGANSTGSNFTNGLTLNSGTLQIAASSALSAGTIASGPAGIGTLTINGGILQALGTIANPSAPETLNNNVVLGGSFTLTGANALILAGNSLSGGGATTAAVTVPLTINVTDPNGSLTFGSLGTTSLPLTGTAALTKAGPGILNLDSGTSSYSGAVTVNGRHARRRRQHGPGQRRRGDVLGHDPAGQRQQPQCRQHDRARYRQRDHQH
jgi:autotransporter-associated beta strand protein